MGFKRGYQQISPEKRRRLRLASRERGRGTRRKSCEEPRLCPRAVAGRALASNCAKSGTGTRLYMCRASRRPPLASSSRSSTWEGRGVQGLGAGVCLA